jgi:nucleoside permease NupC
MTGGFATIAGTVLAAYIGFGIDPAKLISASVMAAPTALAFSKLFYPETEKSRYKTVCHDHQLTITAVVDTRSLFKYHLRVKSSNWDL